MIVPPQTVLVTAEPPVVVAEFWEQMTEAAPDVFNAFFVLAPRWGQGD